MIFFRRDANRIATKLRAELLCDDTRLFISWQNPPIPLRFLSPDTGCGDSGSSGFPSANPTVRSFGKAVKKVET